MKDLKKRDALAKEVYLFYLKNYSVEEIAKRYYLTSQTVRGLLRRAEEIYAK